MERRQFRRRPRWGFAIAVLFVLAGLAALVLRGNPLRVSAQSANDVGVHCSGYYNSDSGDPFILRYDASLRLVDNDALYGQGVWDYKDDRLRICWVDDLVESIAVDQGLEFEVAAVADNGTYRIHEACTVSLNNGRYGHVSERVVSENVLSLRCPASAVISGQALAWPAQ